MTIYIDTVSPKNNFVSYNTFSIYNIPSLSLHQYFGNSKENIYFLALSMFQLCTYHEINILPRNWSPSGPFSTLIPLILCYLLELFAIILIYAKNLYKTYIYNYYNTVDIIRNNIKKKIIIKDIKVGDLLIIPKNTIIPVDCLAYHISNSNYIEISLSNLNGECTIHSKDCISNISAKPIEDLSIVHIKDNSNTIDKFDAISIINNHLQYKLNHIHFIPGGSINRGESCIVLVTQIGTQIRSYTSCDKDNVFHRNFIDNKITKSLTNIFIPLLGLYTLSMVYFTISYNKTYDIYYTAQAFIQSWILLNGIVPFSIKVIVMTNRNIQAYIKSNQNIEYIVPSSIDNCASISRLICDKTGTITKNELYLSYISHDTTIYNLNILKDYNNIPFNVLSTILIGLHHKNNIFSTDEDKIISERIISLGITIETFKTYIKLYRKNQLESYHILEQDLLEFDCKRKLSSIIYYSNDPNNTYIVTKGSLTTIETLLKPAEKERFITIKNEYNSKYPFLRTIGFAIKKIHYDASICPKIYEEDGEYNFISILGIEDEIQEKVQNTVQCLKKHNKSISICTGDRYETAMYISETIGILSKTQIMLTDTIPDSYLKHSTFIFNSRDILYSIRKYDLLHKFKHYLLHSNNCVAYSLIPKDKQFIISLLEGNSVNCIAVGDGTNDIPMIKTATVGIGVKNDYNTNVVNNSSITIRKFCDLEKTFSDADFCYKLNCASVCSVFFKTVLVNTLIYLYIIRNNYDLNNILFSFIDIQGHHLLWGLIPILGNNYANKISINNHSTYIIPIVTAVMNATVIIHLNIGNEMYYKKYILLTTIVSMNIQFLFVFGYRNPNIFLCVISILIGSLYVFSFRDVVPDIF